MKSLKAIIETVASKEIPANETEPARWVGEGIDCSLSRRSNITILRGQNLVGAEYPGMQRSDTPIFPGISLSSLKHHHGCAKSECVSFDFDLSPRQH